jgi:hypothetical protein
MRTYGSLRDETPVSTTVTKTINVFEGYDNPSLMLYGFMCGGDPNKIWYATSSGTKPAPTCNSPTPLGIHIFSASDNYFLNNIFPSGNYELLCEGSDLSFSGLVSLFVVSFMSQCTTWSEGLAHGIPLGYIATTSSSITTPVENNGTTLGYGFSKKAIDQYPIYKTETIDVSTTVSPPPGLGSNCSNSNLNGITNTVPGFNPNFGATSLRPTCAAEVFDFSPEYYLSSPVTQQTNNQANSASEIYNLPPVL